MLNELLDSIDFYGNLEKIDSVCPLPKASDRTVWDCLDVALKEKYIKRAEAFLSYEYPSLLTTHYMNYVRNGNRSRYEKTYFDRRMVISYLVVGECIEYKGRFLDDIINGILLVCEETSWVMPAHNNGVMMPYSDDVHIDVFAAETGAMLSIIYFLFGDKLDAVCPLINYRMKIEVKKRIFRPYMENDFWWMSFGVKKPSIWNAWCNLNSLISFLLLEEDKDNQRKAVEKIVRSLDKFIDYYKKDGGEDDGISYWEQGGGCLFEAFEFLSHINNKIEVVFADIKINNMLNFPYKAHIDEFYYFNFADSSTIMDINKALLYRIGDRTKNDSIARFSKYLCNVAMKSEHERTFFEGKTIYRYLMDVFFENMMLKEDTNVVCIEELRDIFIKGIEAMVVRENTSGKSLYLAAKCGHNEGGHNDKEHNHNDVGSFIVYKDGKPFLIDVGIEVYTSKTFSDDRFKIWTMQSQYHNLPTICGVMQKPGSLCRAKNVVYYCTENLVTFSFDIADAYEDFDIVKFGRIFKFHRGGSAYIEITDEYVLSSHKEDTFYYFMCAQKPVLTSPGNIEFFSGDSKLNLFYDAGQFSFVYEEIELDDLRLLPAWGTKIYRVVLKLLHKDLKGKICFKIQ